MSTLLLILALSESGKSQETSRKALFPFLDNLAKNLAPAEIWHHVAEALVFVRCLPEVRAYLCPHALSLHTLCLVPSGAS